MTWWEIAFSAFLCLGLALHVWVAYLAIRFCAAILEEMGK